jgi:predicted hydrocarbon binding protein
MVVRKHISFEKKDLDRIKPFLERHNGNFSAAIREVIDHAIDPKPRLTCSDRVILFDYETADYLLRKTQLILPEKELLNEIADPKLLNSISGALEYFNMKYKELGWGLDFVISSDSDTAPVTAALTITGENDHLIYLASKLFSLFIAENKHMGIEDISRRTKSIRISYRLRDRVETAFGDLFSHLGTMNELFSEIEKKPDFWSTIVKKYRDSNYRMVTVHFNHYEELLAKRTPIGEIGIELLAKRPIKDIPLREFLHLMKEVYETAGVVERIDININNLQVFHSYRNPRAVDTLKKIFLHLMEMNGHTYTAISTRNLIILNHMPEIGIRISELMTNLRDSGSNFDMELIGFLTFLGGLRDAPDVSNFIRALGYRMSKQILQEYEKEHRIQAWDMKSFQEAFSFIDSKIGRLSEWKSLDDNSACYAVKKCTLVRMSHPFNINICHFSRGVFRGAVEHAFKNDADIKVLKLLSHGDDRCEVCIRAHISLP